MKKGNILFIIFFLLVFGFLIFLIKEQKTNNNLEFKNFFRNNQQTSKTTQSEKEILTNQYVFNKLTLEITEPKENTLYKNPSIKIFGKTLPYAEVYINDIETKADESGNFFAFYTLDEGENLLTIVANDSLGNYAEKEITVYLQTEE